jgi:hypothetical protein
VTGSRAARTSMAVAENMDGIVSRAGLDAIRAAHALRRPGLRVFGPRISAGPTRRNPAGGT